MRIHGLRNHTSKNCSIFWMSNCIRFAIYTYSFFSTFFFQSQKRVLSRLNRKFLFFLFFREFCDPHELNEILFSTGKREKKIANDFFFVWWNGSHTQIESCYLIMLFQWIVFIFIFFCQNEAHLSKVSAFNRCSKFEWIHDCGLSRNRWRWPAHSKRKIINQSTDTSVDVT